MNTGKFTVEELRPMRDGMTISRDSKISSINKVTWFSLGKDTSISPECYDRFTVYIMASGEGEFLLGPDNTPVKVSTDDVIIVNPGVLCGMRTDDGLIYTEIIIEKEISMNANVKAGEVMQLKDLISYEEGSIANLDIVHNDTMKYVLMAFDKGTGLTPHRAPGNAIVFALEGSAVIGYEGKDYTVKAGECFHFAKNGLHSVSATDERFKMALLLVLAE